MKKVSLLMLVSYALCLLGCEPAELESNQTTGERLVRIGVSAESSGTKVAIADDLSFSWTVGDRIAVWAGEGYCISEPYVSGNMFDVFLNGTRANYAVYPASSAVAAHATASSLQVSLPTEYTIASGQSNDYSPLPMIAANAENSDLAFKHLGGLIRLSVTDIPTTTTKIVVDLGQKIAGTFEVQNPAAVGTADCKIVAGTGSTAVTFHLAEACEEVTLNLPVPTGTYTSITVTALNASNTVLETWTPTINWTCARAHGKKLQPAVSTESMRIIISTSETLGRTFHLPFGLDQTLPTDLTIDWGDGTTDTYPSGTTVTSSTLMHTYAVAADGDHTITITSSFASNYTGARIPSFSFNQNSQNYRDKGNLKSLPDPILTCNTTSMQDAFRGCKNLEFICEDLFTKNPDVTSFFDTFSNCSGLTGTIPAGLFANNSKVTSFFSTFGECTGLTGAIPEDLFANNPEVTSFYGTFLGCSGLTSIPEDLFANNPEVTSFYSTFSGCSGLTSIPEDLFANNPEVITFRQTFLGCSNLTSIPENLFANNPDATEFISTFGSCSSLTAIPEGLFAHNEAAECFDGTFANCSGLTAIPEDLFIHNPLANNFQSTFLKCSNITDIPEQLFSQNPDAKYFGGVFAECTGLTSIPAGLFAQNTEAVSFSDAFYGCTGLTGTLPSGLFSHNLKCAFFYRTFYWCYNVQVCGDLFIQAGVSDKTTRFADVSSADFSFCFWQTGVYLSCEGTAPDLWNYTLPSSVNRYRCFDYSRNYTNGDDIPEEWWR